jgi:hypothetical protein
MLEDAPHKSYILFYVCVGKRTHRCVNAYTMHHLKKLEHKFLSTVIINF